MDIKHQLTGLRIQTKITQQNGSPSRKNKESNKMFISISSYLGSNENQIKVMKGKFFAPKNISECLFKNDDTTLILHMDIKHQLTG